MTYMIAEAKALNAFTKLWEFLHCHAFSTFVCTPKVIQKIWQVHARLTKPDMVQAALQNNS